ncbi:hypothetical protein ARALYDRAFT_330573 [Arabidopsis lyrata subsp. lyrata]|uniref:Transferase family protein n=1 Tax=Arabidopsis lyrata subsp. lyrata TaxID=81972 RepID=D7MJR8_ARALL|nr:hypothetical protein ARALYDRAFT_330573 [Arabidopsis lyrata subsp. lyrata]
MELNVIKTVCVSPVTNLSNGSFNIPNLPLTFFDLHFMKSLPTQQIIFYKLAESSSRESFHSLILPKLERSLSIVLHHYLPLAGCLLWKPHDPKPCIVVSKHDTVSLTIAETSSDFSFVSGNGLRPATYLHPLVPELSSSKDSAAVLSLQITLFPNQGFCIGIASHHAVLDGKTLTMFIKSWAHICSLQEHNKTTEFPLLPDDLIPCFDRTVINVVSGLETKMLELLLYLSKDIDDLRSLKLPPIKDISSDVVRATLELTPKNIQKLRERVKNESARSPLELHLSTFIISYAHAWKCMTSTFLYAADFRHQLDPQVPARYFGNYVFLISWFEYQARTFLEKDGFVKLVEILSDSVKSLSSRGIKSICEDFVEGSKDMIPDAQIGSVAWSPQFGLYGSDFGWGRPAKTGVVSIDRNEAFSMSERRDEQGGMEMEVCLKKSEMHIFLSLFKKGLSD